MLSCEFSEFFKSIFIYRTPPVVASKIVADGFSTKWHLFWHGYPAAYLTENVKSGESVSSNLFGEEGVKMKQKVLLKFSKPQ